MSPIQGGEVKRLREKLDLTQRDLAREADLRQALISQIENGAVTQAVSIEQLERLARALGVKPAKLLEP